MAASAVSPPAGSAERLDTPPTPGLSAPAAPHPASSSGAGALSRPQLGWRAHLVTMLLATWLLVGLFVDGWAHINLEELETFFTPWHALFYSGFMATALWMGWLVVRQLRLGRRGLRAIPHGYELGMVGLVTFAVGGFGDMLWHIAFGIEVDIEALLSPTHLLLLAGMAMIMATPFWSAWSSPASDAGRPALSAFLPTVLSLTLVTTLFSFFTMYLSGFSNDDLFAATVRDLQALGASAGRTGLLAYLNQRSGIGGILFSNFLLMAPVLLMLRRWQPPFGTVTILFTLTTLLMTALDGFEYWPYVIASVAAGLVADGLIQRLRPSAHNLVATRLLAAVVPLVLWGGHVLTVQWVWELGWALELSSGVVVLASLSALVISFLIMPPLPPPPSPRWSEGA
ncbi:MAG TPA: hypothetical protein VHS99_13130 [Chloroflexota bacterium]|nr:hypothetical protein [Chloroflexota bacterium]